MRKRKKGKHALIEAATLIQKGGKKQSGKSGLSKPKKAGSLVVKGV